MDKHHLATTITYIDNHLDAELNPADLASLINYSPRHLTRLFKSATGETPAHYQLKRRLQRALLEIASGEPAINAVLRFGFDTYPGFYKAFIRMYGCSPRAYLRIYSSGLPALTEWRNLIMPTKSELTQLLANWPDRTDAKIHHVPIMRGERMSDTAFRIGDDAMLKLYPSEQSVQHMLKLAALLSAQGVPASIPFPTATGAAYTSQNGLHAALVRRIPGDPLSMDEWFSPRGTHHAAQAGRALAHLHAALREIEPGIDTADANLFQTCAEWAVPAMRKQDAQWGLGLGDALFDEYLARFGALYPDLPRQLIHRDPHPGNMLFADGQFSGFIDFELSERNVRMYDICYAATGILSECGGSAGRYAMWTDLLRGIVGGYDEVAPLSEAERASVYWVVLSIQFICCAYFESVDDPLMKKLAATNRQMLQYIATRGSEMGVQRA